jgi:hypothetical protein
MHVQLIASELHTVVVRWSELWGSYVLSWINKYSTMFMIYFVFLFVCNINNIHLHISSNYMGNKTIQFIGYSVQKLDIC